jgi:WD40 repeat protein
MTTQLLAPHVSPDGMTLARLAQDRRSVQLIDLADGTEEGRVTAQSRILDVTFSPTGSVLVLTLPNGSIHIWDRARQSERHIRDGNLRSPALSFNAEASLLAAYSREAGALTLWSTANGDLLSREFETVGRADGPPAVPFFSADGRTIYLMPYQAKRKYIQRWRVPGAGPGTGPVGRSGPMALIRLDDLPAQGPLFACAVSPDDTTVLLLQQADIWGGIVVVDTGTGKARIRLNSAGLDAMALSPSGRLVATAGESRIQLTDVATGATRGELCLTGRCRDLAFSRDGWWLVVLLRGSGPSRVQRYGLVVTPPADSA